MAINPCTSLSEKLEQQVSALEDIETTTLTTLNSVKTQIENYTDSITDTDDLNSVLGNITDEALGSDSSAVNQISNFVGSCLDDVINKADEFADNVLDSISDLFNSVPTLNSLAEKALGQAMAGLKSLLAGYKIPDLLSELDRIMGCLSDQPDLADCVSGLQNKSNRINSVLSNLSLDSSGVFDQSTFLASMPTVDSLLKNNINSITNKMDTVEALVVSNIETVKKSISGALPSEDLF